MISFPFGRGSKFSELSRHRENMVKERKEWSEQ